MSDDDRSAADPLGQIADEFVEAFRQGKRPSVEEFARRYPEHADDIREMLPALLLMEKAKSGDGAPGRERPAKAAAAAAGPLSQLGDYQILREVGRGGMGVVYEAQQLSLARHVAIKVLPAHALLDPRHLGRFQREARSAAKLHHTNIVPVFGVGEQGGLHYYVMQFIQGLGLDVVLDELRRLRLPRGQPAATQAEAPGRPTHATRDVSAVAVARGLLSGAFTASGGRQLPVAPAERGADAPRSPDTSATIHLPGQSEGSTLTESGKQYWQSVARVGLQVADALAHASSQGVLHRDIKPSNLLLDDTGNVWVTDFGLAKAASDSDDLTHTGDVVGTLRYMAPERFNGQGDLRSDIYSLGLTLYEMLTLRPAFDESDRNKLVKHVLHDEPARPRKVHPGVPRDLETVVLKAIARDPAHRYQTPAEMGEDLKRFVEDRPVKARPVSETEKLWRWCRRNPLPASLLAGIVLIFLIGFAGVILQWRVAESARQNEEKQRGLAEAEKLKSQRMSAGLALDRGLQLCQEGKVSEGLLWMAESLAVNPEEDRGFADVVRLNLAAWRATMPVRRTVIGHERAVNCVAYSPGGKTVVTAAGGTVRRWDAVTGEPVGQALVQPGAVLSLAYSPDGRLIATGSDDKMVRIWDVEKGKQVGPTMPQSHVVNSVAFSRNGRWLVAATGKRDYPVPSSARVWDVATGRPATPPLAAPGDRPGRRLYIRRAPGYHRWV
jgi:serine/threonine protein kinase